MLLPHRYSLGPNEGSSGNAEYVDGVRRDAMMVSLYCEATETNVGFTILHELGHNFGLQHGGDSPCNRKPNYNSIMNYRYQFSGVDVDCDGNVFEGPADFSHGLRAPLDETKLLEPAGLQCGGPPVDWNKSNSIEQVEVSANINKYPLESDEISECGTLLPTSLADYDDGSAIEIGVDASVSIGSGGGGNADSATSVACPGPGE